MYTNPSNLKSKKKQVVGRRIGSLFVIKREWQKYLCRCEFIEKRFEEDNGVTLCACCHKKIHKIFGKKTVSSNWAEFQSSEV